MRVGETLKGGKLVGTAAFDFVPKDGETVSAQEIGGHLAQALFVTKTRTLADLVEAGIFMPLAVRQAERIPHGKKTVHLKRETPGT